MRRSPTGRGRSVTLRVVALGLLFSLVPASALAHAELDTITPADKSTVGTAPTEIVATFTEELDPSKSSLVVVTSSGSQVASGGEVDATDKKKLTLTLPALEPGAYEIRWTSTSAEDGDIARGVTTFTFTPAPTPTPTPSLAPSATPAPTAAPTPSPSLTAAPSPSGSGTPTASNTDILIPIVVAALLVAGLGYWLLRGRSRAGGPS
jgi:methionine-rich copper-binding protein CopC